MGTNVRPVPVACFVFLIPTLAEGAPNIHEGLWEITSEVQIKAGSSRTPTLPASRQTQCLRRNDIEHPANIVPQQSGCSVEDVNVSGDRVRWQMQCAGILQTRGIGETIYGGDTFAGSATFVSEADDLRFELTTIYNDRRIGNCR